jgi:type III pantothenate kinase
MKLLIDIGNSRMKWAWSSAEGLIRFGQTTHRNRDFSAALAELLHGSTPPVEVRVANVAGPAAGALLNEAVYERFRVRPVFARSPDSAYGLKSGYRSPGQLGIDRWLAMCAAWQKLSCPLCVVDAGTAITIDTVMADGAHSGGLILPGIRLMAAALRQETGDLDRVAGPALPQDISALPMQGGALGVDTAGAIQLGATRAIMALVADCLSRLNAEVDGAKLAITGGDGAWLAGLLGVPAACYPNLVLEGLALEPACYSTD